MSLANNSLKKKKDIDRVFKNGKAVKESCLTLKTVKNDLASPRFGFVISKKVSKKASTRNKLRRRMKGLIRAAEKIRNTDNLLIVGPGLETKSFKELEELITKLFKRAGIIENNE